jgi:hypothetical protein
MQARPKNAVRFWVAYRFCGLLQAQWSEFWPQRGRAKPGTVSREALQIRQPNGCWSRRKRTASVRNAAAISLAQERQWVAWKETRRWRKSNDEKERARTRSTTLEASVQRLDRLRRPVKQSAAAVPNSIRVAGSGVLTTMFCTENGS